MSFRSTCLLVAALLAASAAHADEAPAAARAEQLFDAGKRALAEGDLTSACAQLAESHQLEPATGSLLALAMCHERKGELAHAAAAYREVLSRSLKEGRSDRAKLALEKSEALEKRISHLTIYTTLSEETPTLTVRLNGAVLRTDQLGTQLPVGGNAVLVEASAPGKQAFRTSVTISGEGQQLYVTVPVLSGLPGTAPAARAFAAEGHRAPPAPGPRHAAARYVGIGLLGASALGLAMAGGYTIRAANRNRDSQTGCNGNVCDDAARVDRLDARRAGNVATAALATGAALGAAGLFTYLWGRKRQRDDRAPALRASGWAYPGAAGGSLQGSF